MSTYTIYKADYNPNPTYLESDPLKVNFDEGNIALTATEPITANSKFQRIIHKSIDHLYYKHFLDNNKAAFGSGNINKQDRILEDQAYVISLAQSKFGEAIMPGSVAVSMSCEVYVLSGSYAPGVVVCPWNVVDDGFGNLFISGSGFYSPYGEFVGGAFTNYTSSVTKPLAGMWPQDDIYKYINASSINLTQSFNKGLWQMDALYTNVRATYLSGSLGGLLEEPDFLGAAWSFTSTDSSSIQIKTNVSSDYNQRYNFENDNFSISMIIKPSAEPTHTSGSMLITKQGPVEELRIDENGNVYSQIVPNKTPYRLLYDSGSLLIRFEKDSGNELFQLTSAISASVDSINHVVVTKSGSLYTLHVNNAIEQSVASGSTTISDRLTSNLSNIFVGNSYTADQGFDGVIDNIKIYRDTLTQNDVNILFHTLGVGNLYVGNVYYNHGMIILSSIPAKFADILSVSSRGTHTIWETEISCTVSPGEFGMSCNPTLQEYNAVYNQYVYRPFVTSSYFKPYITSIGLYDDYGNLLAIGKVNTPIQTPNNVDTTFIVRFDR